MKYCFGFISQTPGKPFSLNINTLPSKAKTKKPKTYNRAGGTSLERVRARVGSSLRAVLRARVDLRLPEYICSKQVGELRRRFPLTPINTKLKTKLINTIFTETCVYFVPIPARAKVLLIYDLLCGVFEQNGRFANRIIILPY